MYKRSQIGKKLDTRSIQNNGREAQNLWEVQGWSRGESTRLPTHWHRFDSRTRRHMSLLLVLVPAPRIFLRVLRFTSLPKNQYFRFQFDPRIRSSRHAKMRVTNVKYLFFILYFFAFNLTWNWPPWLESPQNLIVFGLIRALLLLHLKFLNDFHFLYLTVYFCCGSHCERL